MTIFCVLCVLEWGFGLEFLGPRTNIQYFSCDNNENHVPLVSKS